MYSFVYLFTLYLYSGGKNDYKLVFSAAKNGVKSVISIFRCSVSEGNISLHSQTFI